MKNVNTNTLSLPNESIFGNKKMTDRLVIAYRFHSQTAATTLCLQSSLMTQFVCPYANIDTYSY